LRGRRRHEAIWRLVETSPRGAHGGLTMPMTQLPAMRYSLTGSGASTASSGRRSGTAGSRCSRTTRCAGPIRGSAGRTRAWRSSSAAPSSCGRGRCVRSRPPLQADRFSFDRPVAGYGGRTINTLRLRAAAVSDLFNFEVFSHGKFVGAVAERLGAESSTRDASRIVGQRPNAFRIAAL
jgi:hypothetical protein